MQPVVLGLGTYDVLKLKLAVRKNAIPTTNLSFVDGQECPGTPKVRNLISNCGIAMKPALLSLNLTPPAGTAAFNTLPGTNVDVCLRPNVWVTFANISAPQVTTATPVGLGAANFNLPGMFPKWKLGPSGVYPGGVTVNFRYPCTWLPAQKAAAQLFHKPTSSSTWSLVATTNDTCTNVLSGVVPSFSEFGIVLPPELVTFRRGDGNADQRIDISDGIMLLGCQFLGTICPICPDAGDANDDGRLDIGDAISIFNYQFLGGREPALPGPQTPGLDPTEDSLGPCTYPVELDEEGTEEEPAEDA